MLSVYLFVQSLPLHVTFISARYLTRACVDCCSGFATGIYTTNSPEACQFVAEDADCNIIVVYNDTQLQKFLQVRDQLPNLKAIVQYKGQPKQPYPNVYSVKIFY